MRQDFLSVYNEERQLGIRLPILFESEDLIAIDKPDGYSSSEILIFFGENLTKNQFKNRNIFDPKNIFDLQSEISGILIFAKNKESSAKWRNYYGSQMLSMQFDVISCFSDAPKNEPIHCTLPIAKHCKEDRMLISSKTGKKSSTVFEFIENIGNFESWSATCRILRHDQIFLHAHECGIDIFNEVKYAEKTTGQYTMPRSPKFEQKDDHWTKSYIPIHLSSISFKTPDITQTITSPLPKKFQSLMKIFKKCS